MTKNQQKQTKLGKLLRKEHSGKRLADCPRPPGVDGIRCRTVRREDERRGIVIAGKGGKEENGEKERKAASGVR